MFKYSKYIFILNATLKILHTFLRINDMTPIRVRTCCRLKPSRGTPSAKISALSAPGSQR